MKNIVILYHNDCLDGFSGAWAAWKKFGRKADYIGVNHNEPPPKGLKDKEIYMIDFTYPEQIIKKMLHDNRRVTSIDHHISAKKATLMTHNPLFDNDHSGAVLAWKYFHQNKKIPQLLKYVEDIDLWRFALPYTEEIIAALDIEEKTFKNWSALVRNLEDYKKRREYINRGAILLKYENVKVDYLADKKAVLVKFEGYKTYAVNTPVFISKTGHVLTKKLPPIAIIWHQADNKVIVSLRSNGRVDVSKIAKKYGGGGHKAAAGFTLKSLKDIPWKAI